MMNQRIIQLLDDVVADDAITEVQCNGTTSLFLKKGRREEHRQFFQSIEEYKQVIQELIDYIQIQQSDYLVEESVQYKGVKMRIHLVMPPAVPIPVLTIVKKTVKRITLKDMLENGTMNQTIFHFLIACIRTRKNIVISGATGSGKTTLLEALAEYIEEHERIGVVEDVSELQLKQANTVYLHSKPWKPSTNPLTEIKLDWLIKQVNRMRVDRIIVGETRGSEFSDFLLTANSGIEGVITTIHANSCRLALKKMAQFALAGQPSLNMRAVNQLISQVVDVIIQVEQKNGRFKITEIEALSYTLSDKESAEIASSSFATYNEEQDSWSTNSVVPMRLADTIRR